MIIPRFITRLNWRLIVVHFIATWFFKYAFQVLALLHNTTLVDIARQTGNGDLSQTLSDHGVSASELTNFILWNNYGNAIGFLVAFGISLTITIRRNWYWFNAVLVFVLVYVLAWFNLPGWNYWRPLFLLPGKIFSNTTAEFLANGLLLLAVGLLTFFLPVINRFIERGNRVKPAYL